MSRPPKTVRSVYFNIGLPEDLAARIKLALYSDLEEKIPHGAQQAFFVNLVKEHFDAIDKAAATAGQPSA